MNTMNKMMILFSLILGASLVLFGSGSFAQKTSYLGTGFQGMSPYSHGFGEGDEEGAPQGSIFHERFVGLKAYDPTDPGFTRGSMEGVHEPSNWQKVVGGLSPYAPDVTE